MKFEYSFFKNVHFLKNFSQVLSNFHSQLFFHSLYTIRISILQLTELNLRLTCVRTLYTATPSFINFSVPSAHLGSSLSTVAGSRLRTRRSVSIRPRLETRVIGMYVLPHCPKPTFLFRSQSCSLTVTI